MRAVIVGAGGFGHELRDWIWDNEPRQEALLIDDDPQRSTVPIDAYQPEDGDRLYLAVGNSLLRHLIWDRLRPKMFNDRSTRQGGARLATFIHRTAIVARSAMIHPGCILCPYSLISSRSVLWPGVHVNAFSSAGHDVTIGQFCTLAAHVDLCGGVTLEDYVAVGSGARILPGLRVGHRAVVGAGAVVYQSVKGETTIYVHPTGTLPHTRRP